MNITLFNLVSTIFLTFDVVMVTIEAYRFENHNSPQGGCDEKVWSMGWKSEGIR